MPIPGLRSTFTSRQYRKRSGLLPGWPFRGCSKRPILSTLGSSMKEEIITVNLGV